jgi:hypothetical protein
LPRVPAAISIGDSFEVWNVGWIKQGNRRYYHRSVRKDRRVTHQYFGNGPEAKLAALIDQERQRQRRLERQARIETQEAWREVSQPLNHLSALSDLLLRATLLVSGFYQHHGSEWRRRRERRRTD